MSPDGDSCYQAEGAQTSLICATQAALVSGEYYHNTMGRIILRKEDPATGDSKHWLAITGSKSLLGRFLQIDQSFD